MDKKENCKNKRKEENVIQSYQQSLDNLKKEIKKSYKMGIEYYQEVEDRQDE